MAPKKPFTNIFTHTDSGTLNRGQDRHAAFGDLDGQPFTAYIIEKSSGNTLYASHGLDLTTREEFDATIDQAIKDGANVEFHTTEE